MATTTIEKNWEEEFKHIITKIDQLEKLSATCIGNIHQQQKNLLEYAFLENANIDTLLLQQSNYVDTLVCKLWKQLHPDSNHGIAIVAVGGYGRQEMHPSSDVDLLILLPDHLEPEHEASISAFVTQLWDLKFEVGQSVRTLDECLSVANDDLTIITNLIEARFLCGNESLFKTLQTSITPDKLWDSPRFFQAKLEEQEQRYTRYGDTAYRVEPNLKESPGGLRDLHMIIWVTEREYGVLSIKELYEEELLTEIEYTGLLEAREFLWKVRFGLHLLSNRKEDRLLLDYQVNLAEQFGYPKVENSNLAVENFMQDYYSTITRLKRLNELLLGIYREHILPLSEDQTITINDWCVQKGKYLAITNDNIFTDQPHTLLEIFYILQTHSGLRGLVPQTIRLIHSHLPIIDDEYRAKTKHKKIFLNIMSESHGITHVLRRMNRYGILAAWIPVFGNIVGRMQFDLFHAYTVDDHTLRLISSLRKNSTTQGAKEFPQGSLIFNSLPDPKILYLAGLFHDIAKGRGGSHSGLGAIDAYDFCHAQGIDIYASSLVSWLVRNHLIMSVIAQRQDLSDPDVIRGFADKVVDSTRLDYLYLLTIADIKATNPSLWNGWKGSLLKSLYDSTRRLLKHGMPPASYTKLLKQKRDAVLEQLPLNHIDLKSGEQYCDSMGSEYMRHHSVDTILWQMSHIKMENVYPLLQLRDDPLSKTTLLFIYTPEKEALFAKTTSALERLNYNIVGAYIMTTPNNFALETLNLLNEEGKPLENLEDKAAFLSSLRNKLTDIEYTPDSIEDYRTPRQLKSFNNKTRISIEQDEERKQTRLIIRALDVPGLLSALSKIFYDLGLQVVSARISTLGEEAEDTFFLTTADDKAIEDEDLLKKLQDTIREQLDTSET